MTEALKTAVEEMEALLGKLAVDAQQDALFGQEHPRDLLLSAATAMEQAVALIRELSAEREKAVAELREQAADHITSFNEGYAEAIQDADILTGGDGEYVYVMGPDPDERHCPDPAAMKARIKSRFTALSAYRQSAADDAETVERVARAIYQVHPHYDLDQGFAVMSWEELVTFEEGAKYTPTIDIIRDKARAAIAALQEPRDE